MVNRILFVFFLVIQNSGLCEPKSSSNPNHIAVQRTLRQEDLYNLEAAAFYNKGLWARSIEMWKQIIAKTPNHLPSLNNLATAFFNKRHYKEALVFYKRVIELDRGSRKFPNARFFGPMAYFKQFGDLDEVHGQYIAEYLEENSLDHRLQAEKLWRIAINKVSSSKIRKDRIKILQANLALSEKNVVHFWAEWCDPCLDELRDLFQFHSRYPNIHFLIVSIDAEYDKIRSDKRLNEIFSPHKSSKNDNIQFLLDNQKLLWKFFFPVQENPGITVPRTVFLNGASPIHYIPRQVNWNTLDIVSAWQSNDSTHP